MTAGNVITFGSILLLVVVLLAFGTVERVDRTVAAFARWRARRACLDRIEGCTRRDRHYHPGSGVAP